MTGDSPLFFKKAGKKCAVLFFQIPHREPNVSKLGMLNLTTKSDHDGKIQT